MRRRERVVCGERDTERTVCFVSREGERQRNVEEIVFRKMFQERTESFSVEIGRIERGTRTNTAREKMTYGEHIFSACIIMNLNGRCHSCLFICFSVHSYRIFVFCVFMVFVLFSLFISCLLLLFFEVFSIIVSSGLS